MKHKTTILIALGALALSSCGVIGGGGKKKETPTLGNRVDILGTEADTKVDPNLNRRPVHYTAMSYLR